MKAVIDRFENDSAVVLIGDDEQQIILQKDMLPEGVKEGSWLKVNFELDSRGEDNQRTKIQNLLYKLKNK
jgi:hypothetical protein